MPDAPRPTPGALPYKAKILIHSFVDFAIDLLLPTAIYGLLAPTNLPPVLRLTIGGFFVAAKASAGQVAPGDQPGAGPAFRRSLLVGLLLSALASGVTILAHNRGSSDRGAIALGTGVLAVTQGIHLLHHRRRLDSFALLVLVEVAATILLTSLSSNERFLLLRPGFYTMIAAVYVLTTVWSPRPFMMQASKPMAAGGDPVRGEAFERAGRESPAFRRAEQAMTVGLAAVLLAEAVLRVVVVFSLTRSSLLASWLWSQLPAVGLFVLYVVVVRVVFIPRASRAVDAFMPRTE